MDAFATSAPYSFSLSPAPSREAPPRYLVSYYRSVTAFTGYDSTLPPHNASDLHWQPVFPSQAWLDEYWPTLPTRPSAEQTDNDTCIDCTPGAITTFAYSDPLPLSFNAFGDLLAAVHVSPAGVLVMRERDAPPPFDPAATAGGNWQGVGTSRRMPDPHLMRLGPFVSWGYSSSNLWHMNVTSMQWCNLSFIDPTQGDLPMNVFILQADLHSQPNASRSDQSRYRFQLELNEQSGNIILHIAELSGASAMDMANGLSIGVNNHEIGRDFDAIYASMYMQNGLIDASANNLSATITFLPYATYTKCLMHGDDCGACIASPECMWCPETSSCIGVTDFPTGKSSASPFCPSGEIHAFCPAAEFINCRDCTYNGKRWCTGEADCSLTPQTSKTYACPSDFQPVSPNQPVGSCVELDAACGTRTCADVMHSSHTRCAAAEISQHPQPGYWKRPQLICMCDVAYAAPTCEVCTQDAFESSLGECELCPPLSATTVGVLTLALLAVTVILVHLNSHHYIKRLMVPIQNGIVWCQLVSSLGLIQLNWPSATRRVFTGITVMALNFFNLPTIACYVTDQVAFGMTTAAPVLVALMLGLGMMSMVIASRIRRRLGIATQESSDRRAHMRRVFLRTFLSFLVIYYNRLVYTALEGYRYVMNVRSARTQTLMLVLIPMSCLYIIGIPLLFAIIIHPRSAHRFVGNVVQCGACCRRPTQRAQVLKPIVAKYRSGWPQYTEATISPMWKIVMNIIIIFGSRATQVVCMGLLLAILIWIYVLGKPYVDDTNNHVQQWMWAGAILILLSGIIFYVGSPGQTGAEVFAICAGYVLAASTAILMFLIIAQAISRLLKEIRQEKASKEHLAQSDSQSLTGDGSVISSASSRQLCAYPHLDRELSEQLLQDSTSDASFASSEGSGNMHALTRAGEMSRTDASMPQEYGVDSYRSDEDDETVDEDDEDGTNPADGRSLGNGRFSISRSGIN